MSESRQEISSRSKEAIFSALKQGYKDKSFNYVPSIDPVLHIKGSGDRLEEMKQKMRDNKFIVEECDKEHLESKINEIVAGYGYEKLIYPSNLGLDIDKINASEKVCFDKEVENLRQQVFHSEFSIINARCGVSSHGVVCVPSSKEQPRMLSLAPTLCIILLKKEEVLKSMSEALNLIKTENPTLPNNILFIAGPSRTADIELITVFGVHGSQKVHLILY